MIQQLEKGRYFISKGTPIPYLCPKCSAVTPFIPGDTVTCVMCGYQGDKDEFEPEWRPLS